MYVQEPLPLLNSDPVQPGFWLTHLQVPQVSKYLKQSFTTVSLCPAIGEHSSQGGNYKPKIVVLKYCIAAS